MNTIIFSRAQIEHLFVSFLRSCDADVSHRSSSSLTPHSTGSFSFPSCSALSIPGGLDAQIMGVMGK